MTKKTNDNNGTTKRRSASALSLRVEAVEPAQRNVDAEHFFTVAERWLRALQAFAHDSGQRVTWEIVGLKKSSAFVQVIPVEPRTREPIPELAKKWDSGFREVSRTGHPPEGFRPDSLGALEAFVKAVPTNAIVSVGNGRKKNVISITAEVQRRVEEAEIGRAS